MSDSDLKINELPNNFKVEAEKRCALIGYEVGNAFLIRLQDNWSVKTCVIVHQRTCSHYVVRDEHNGKSFNFYPSIHPHALAPLKQETAP